MNNEIWVLYLICEDGIDLIVGYVTSSRDAYNWLCNYIFDNCKEDKAKEFLLELNNTCYDHLMECSFCGAQKLDNITPPILRV